MKLIAATTATLVIAVALFLAWSGRSATADKTGPLPPIRPSTDYPATAVLATLDQPIPDGKNALWCAAFPLAWKRLQEVVGGALVVDGAEAACRALDQANVREADAPAQGLYVAAGWGREGIVERVRLDMLQRFGHSPEIPELGPLDAMAYAYLTDRVRFQLPYFETEGGISFAGRRVRAFGVGRNDPDEDGGRRRQVHVLFQEPEDGWRSLEEFALDLDRHSRPSQLIVARLTRQSSLADLVARLDAKTAAAKTHPGLRWPDVVSVPEVAVGLRHRFADLEGVVNGGSEAVSEAVQSVQFRLDRSGARMTAEARVNYRAAAGRYYGIDGPFLIVLRLRGATRPYFAAWIENAEILEPR